MQVLLCCSDVSTGSAKPFKSVKIHAVTAAEDEFNTLEMVK
jgi:hypothetical protein